MKKPFLTDIFERGIGFLVFIVLVAGFAVSSCKDDPADEPLPIVLSDYMSVDAASANQMEIKSLGSGQYQLTTTGEDPYVSLKALTKKLAADKLVLTFEYKCAEEISHLQIFFGAPVTEARSLKTSGLAASSVWKSFSADVGKQVGAFDWGAAGDFLRLDFGNQSGRIIQIRNIYFRKRTAEEEAIALEEQQQFEKDQQLESFLNNYLTGSYSPAVTSVTAGASTIRITGSYSGEAIRLAELMPSDELNGNVKFANTYPLSGPSFSFEVDRYITRNGFRYDRALSRWILIRAGNTFDELVSHARYAGQLYTAQELPAQMPAGRKGLGGFSVSRGFTQDLDDLRITSVTVNVAITSMMYLESRSGTIAHTYGGKTYFFDQNAVNELDRTLLAAQSRNIVVAAIILVQKAAECADPAVGALLQHPAYTSQGIFTMPNLTTPESVNCYAAALDFLAGRYCRSDHQYGRIHHWIMHNEVDAALSWTNMGDKPMHVYLDAYVRSMRLCYNISRMYDQNSQVLASFTHSWAEPVECYATRDLLTALLKYSRAEGDFQWGLACHPYPQDLNEPKTWNDSKATFSMNTPLVTFKNLEVLDSWIKKAENRYQGNVKRTLWLSENGTNSRTYGETDLKEQAAGFAWAWKKMKTLDGIDAFQWHNWIDNRREFGLRIGLRRFPDDEAQPGGRKPVWFLYQAAGTDQEDQVFEPYKQVIGISSWEEVRYNGEIY